MKTKDEILKHVYDDFEQSGEKPSGLNPLQHGWVDQSMDIYAKQEAIEFHRYFLKEFFDYGNEKQVPVTDDQLYEKFIQSKETNNK